MDFLSGVIPKDTVDIHQILEGDYIGKTVKLDGAVHNIRDMGDVAFIILRKSEGLVQCVYEAGRTDINLKELREESTVEVTGTVAEEERAPLGFEIRLASVKVLSEPSEGLPIAVNKWKLKTSLETKLALRPITLRNVRERVVFKIQEGVVRAFREFMYSQDFTEIHTPKVVSRGAEGGANVFKLNYFNKKAELAQSPQTYKQMMVGVFDRVFETGAIYRAEKHNTTRHLNEYIGLDFEMGYIDSFEDVMAMETGYLKYLMQYLNGNYKKEMELLGVTPKEVTQIPVVRFDEAKRLVSEKYSRPIRNPWDLEPEEESLIGRYFQEEYDSDFVFVTHYPSRKRPFYTMDDPEDPRYTLSFDCIYKGIEITTGGQRIHDYQTIVDKMISRGMDPEDMKDYLSIFRYGMPPHGGLGIGLERLTMKLLNLQNVREASLFPRDVTRLDP